MTIIKDIINTTNRSVLYGCNVMLFYYCNIKRSTYIEKIGLQGYKKPTVYCIRG